MPCIARFVRDSKSTVYHVLSRTALTGLPIHGKKERGQAIFDFFRLTLNKIQHRSAWLMKCSSHPGLFFIVLGILFFSSIPGLAGSDAGTVKNDTILKNPAMKPVAEIPDNKKLNFDDVLYAEYVSEMAFSPDGSYLIWCKDFCEPGMKTRADNVFVTHLAEGGSTQITFFNGAEINGLKCSPDGKRITFLSDAPVADTQNDKDSGQTVQVWTVGFDGKGLSPLTSLDRDILEYAWRDSDTLLYTTTEKGRNEGIETGDKTIRVSDYCDAPVRLFQLDLQSGRTIPITRNNDRIFSLAVSPDGKKAFYVRTMSKGFIPGHDFYANISFSNYLLDLESGEETKIFEKMRSTGGAVWSPDSKTLYAVD